MSEDHLAWVEAELPFREELAGYARRIVFGQTPEDVDDLLQELHFNIWKWVEQHGNVEGGRVGMRKILHTMLWRLAVRARQQRTQRKQTEYQYAHTIPLGVLDQQQPMDAKILLDELVRGLPDDQRAVFVMIEIEGYTVRDAAEKMTLTKSRVHRIHQTAMEALRGAA
jgi:RNA polymerase sigma factor (sigma-70 family)